MRMKKSETKENLRSIGMSFDEFDDFCNFERGTTLMAFRSKFSDKDLKKKIDEGLASLEEQQEELAIAAIDLILDNIDENKNISVFVPVFPTARVYMKSGYAREYGVYPQYSSDVRSIVNRLMYLVYDIHYFTPFDTNYKVEDVVPKDRKDKNFLIIDPLILRKQLSLSTRAQRREAYEKREIEKHKKHIISVVNDELDRIRVSDEPKPRQILLPAYLCSEKFRKRRPEGLGVHIYNRAVEGAVDELWESCDDFNIALGTHEELEAHPIGSDFVVLDLLKLAYGC